MIIYIYIFIVLSHCAEVLASSTDELGVSSSGQGMTKNGKMSQV